MLKNLIRCIKRPTQLFNEQEIIIEKLKGELIQMMIESDPSYVAVPMDYPGWGDIYCALHRKYDSEIDTWIEEEIAIAEYEEKMR